MGYDTKEFKVTARTSAHNDDRDQRDEALWDELRARITAVASDPRYEPISPMAS
jgi:hypothetical protein